MFHWFDRETGELRRNLWHLIIGDIQDAIWCLKNGYTLIKRRWKYSKEGW